MSWGHDEYMYLVCDFMTLLLINWFVFHSFFLLLISTTLINWQYIYICCVQINRLQRVTTPLSHQLVSSSLGSIPSMVGFKFLIKAAHQLYILIFYNVWFILLYIYFGQHYTNLELTHTWWMTKTKRCYGGWKCSSNYHDIIIYQEP